MRDQIQLVGTPGKWGVFNMPLEDSIGAIEACESMEDLRTALNRIIQNYGFSSFTFIDAGQPNLDVPYYTGTHRPAWERTYLQNDFVHIDPALARVRRSNTPFRWSELKLPKAITRKRPPEVRMMDAAREFGFKEGFVVPFHYRDRLGAIHSSSTVFFWEDEPKWFDSLFSRHSHELHLIMIYWVQRAIDVVRTTERGAKSIFRHDEASGIVRLTQREREAMSWAAQGKTVQDTAEILHLSSETVESYIKQFLPPRLYYSVYSQAELVNLKRRCVLSVKLPKYDRPRTAPQ